MTLKFAKKHSRSLRSVRVSCRHEVRSVVSTGVAKRAAGAGGRRRGHWAAVPTRARTAGAPHDRDGTRGGTSRASRERSRDGEAVCARVRLSWGALLLQVF